MMRRGGRERERARERVVLAHGIQISVWRLHVSLVAPCRLYVRKASDDVYRYILRSKKKSLVYSSTLNLVIVSIVRSLVVLLLRHHLFTSSFFLLLLLVLCLYTYIYHAVRRFVRSRWRPASALGWVGRTSSAAS